MALSRKELEKQIDALLSRVRGMRKKRDKRIAKIEQKLSKLSKLEDQIIGEEISEEEKIRHAEEKIEGEEKKIEEEEQEIEKLEIEIEEKVFEEEDEIRKILAEKKIEDHEIRSIRSKLEKEMGEIERLKDIVDPYISRFTRYDFVQAIVGAVLGIVIQFTFVDAVALTQTLQPVHVTAVFLFNITIGYLLIYKSGLKKVAPIKILKVVPERLAIIYAIALVITTFLLTLFGSVVWGVSTPWEITRQVVVISLAALMGAASLDLVK